MEVSSRKANPLHPNPSIDFFRKHIAEDLCPYTCLFPNCPKKLALYNTREAWRAHIDEEHRSAPYWKCFVCKQSSERFENGENFIAHIKADHPEIISDAQLHMLINIYRKRDPSIESCPLCPWAEKEAWKEHMRTVHGSPHHWECLDRSESLKFRNEGDINVYMQNSEVDSQDEPPPVAVFTSEEESSMFVAMCRTSDAPPDYASCKSCHLCSWNGEKQKNIDFDGLLNHIAEHIHSFSLYSLPWAQTTAEEEKAGENRFKQSVEAVNHWLRSDINPSFPVKEDKIDPVYTFDRDE
jgi:hypothetical protein